MITVFVYVCDLEKGNIKAFDLKNETPFFQSSVPMIRKVFKAQREQSKGLISMDEITEIFLKVFNLPKDTIEKMEQQNVKKGTQYLLNKKCV